ncbi:hypothetical protein [Algoriphagus vanfongensis]|uniref:hypothetical protein n=1 Tax=Algoriphagus vanfongensis TaxID=426371 RepID=UPI00042157C4|nr:hypothetical protein [Algoriphagus vanfongensis]
MKKLIAIAVIFATTSAMTFAQDCEGICQFNQFMSKNLKYGQEIRADKIQGPVTFSLNIDEQGQLKNKPELIAGNELLAEEVFATLNLMDQENTIQHLGSEYYGKEFLMTVEFKLSTAKETGFYVPQESDRQYLDKLNKKIDANPYFPKYYRERAEFYEVKGKKLLAELDQEKAELLKEKEITSIVVVGYLADPRRKSLNSED